MLQMVPFRNLPLDVATLATQTVAGITSSKNKIFAAPLTDPTGKVFLPADTVMDEGTLSGLQTLVSGIDGKLS